MKKTEIANKARTSLHKASFQLKKHSPEILAVVGVVGTVVSTVLACKATTKVGVIMAEAKENVDAIHNCLDDDALTERYSADDGKKDLVIVYAQTGIKFAKLYAPAVMLGALSLGCILTSNQILRKRNIALAAAYATVDKSFKEYRGRVAERFGKELEREIRHNIKAREVKETFVNENGEEQIITETQQVVQMDGYSDYARFFDATSEYWDKTPEYNLMFLRQQQAWASDLLKIKKRLFLNEVYELLGMEPTKAGQVVGWVYDEQNPVGDNYVDFGIYEIFREANRRFVNGYEPVILLDFNVDGNIWDLM